MYQICLLFYENLWIIELMFTYMVFKQMFPTIHVRLKLVAKLRFM